VGGKEGIRNRRVDRSPVAFRLKGWDYCSLGQLHDNTDSGFWWGWSVTVVAAWARV